MSETINLAEVRKRLPELADRAQAGQDTIVARRGREVAALIGIDEYRRLKRLEEQQRAEDFTLLLASPGANDLTEDAARDLSVRVVREICERPLVQHIEITPGMKSGRPRIAGRRITVQNIVIWHERLGLSADEIASAHDLGLADIYAALSYYYDHPSEIDEDIRADDALVEELRLKMPSKLKSKLNA